MFEKKTVIQLSDEIQNVTNLIICIGENENKSLSVKMAGVVSTN